MAEPVAPDRRPIATRNLRLSQVAAQDLARRGISANAISIGGMFAAILAAACLVGTAFAAPAWTRALFLATAACIQLRLLANMLDGMVALATGQASRMGELFNEIPDRISDTVILAAAGYALSGNSDLGWAAATAALFVTYIRAVGKGVGVPGLFQGPMSKSHRMFTLTVACLYLALVPHAWQPLWQLPWPRHPVGILAATLALIIVGGLLTAARRLLRIVHTLKLRG